MGQREKEQCATGLAVLLCGSRTARAAEVPAACWQLPPLRGRDSNAPIPCVGSRALQALEVLGALLSIHLENTLKITFYSRCLNWFYQEYRHLELRPDAVKLLEMYN